MRLEEMLEECATMSLSEEKEEFSGWENLDGFLPRLSGHSCLLVTWKTNPEVEQFKELYMEKSVKNHKRKNKKLVDPGDLVCCNFCNLEVLFTDMQVSDKSLSSVYQILGKVDLF